MKMISCKKIIVNLLIMVIFVSELASQMPVIPAMAAEDNIFPYLMYASSKEDDAIHIYADNMGLNGSIGTNGKVVVEGINCKVNGNVEEQANLEMPDLHTKLQETYFANVEHLENNYNISDININIVDPVVTEENIILEGNVNLTSALYAEKRITFSGDVKNSDGCVIYSENGDVVFRSSNLNLSGLVYAPKGEIHIECMNANLNCTILIAEKITIDAMSINGGFSYDMAKFIGDKNSSINSDVSGNGTSNISNNEAEKEENISGNIASENIASENTISDNAGNGDVQQEEYLDWMEDTDGDELPNGMEDMLGTNKEKADTDEDGLTDYEEFFIMGTNPTIADSITEGTLDGDLDFDNDGITNKREFELGLNPVAEDSDGDGILDNDEMKIYRTDPLKWDSDEDGIGDGDEIYLGLNPTNSCSDGIVKDADRIFHQVVSENSETLSAINKATNPYRLSLIMDASGRAEMELEVRKSSYAETVKNDFVIGTACDLSYSGNVKSARIEFTMDNGVIEQLPELWLDKDGLQGIERISIFKFYEEEGMVFPIVTQYDKEHQMIFAEVNEMGSYCIGDLGMWMQNIIYDENQVKSYNTPMLMSVNEDDNRVKYQGNRYLDIAFFLEVVGYEEVEFNKQKKYISNTLRVFNERLPEVSTRICVMEMGLVSGDWLVDNGGNRWFMDADKLQSALDAIDYENRYVYIKTAGSLSAFNSTVDFRPNADRYIFYTTNGYTYESNSLKKDICKRHKVRYSELYSSRYEYDYDETYHEALDIINQSGGMDMVENREPQEQIYTFITGLTKYDDVYTEEENEPFFPTNPIDPDNPLILDDEPKDEPEEEPIYEYQILVPTSWKVITLKGELNPTNGINSDGDLYTDWEEIDLTKITISETGDLILPTIRDLWEKENKTDDEMENFKFLEIVKKILSESNFEALLDREYLPIKSDPCNVDTDGDKFPDGYEATLSQNDFYPYDDPNPLMSDVTITSLENDYISIDYEYDEASGHDWEAERNKGKNASFGGYQGWFGSDYDSEAGNKIYFANSCSGNMLSEYGCGLIAAADLHLYMLKSEMDGDSYIIKNMDGSDIVEIDNDFSHIDYDTYKKYIEYYSKFYICHGSMGVYPNGFFNSSLENGISKFSEVNGYNIDVNWICGTNFLYEKNIKNMLNQDIPVLFSYNDTGTLINNEANKMVKDSLCSKELSVAINSMFKKNGLILYKINYDEVNSEKNQSIISKYVFEPDSHYMNITEFLEFSDETSTLLGLNGNNKLVVLSCWGEKYYVDFSQIYNHVDAFNGYMKITKH